MLTGMCLCLRGQTDGQTDRQRQYILAPTLFLLFTNYICDIFDGLHIKYVHVCMYDKIITRGSYSRSSHE